MRKVFLLISTIALLCFGCKKSKPVITPDPASPLLPLKNGVCIEGQIVSESQSLVQFDWTDAKNATSYEVVIKNLSDTVTSTHVTDKSEIAVPIKRGKAYSWYVVSKNNTGNKTSNSDTWMFYNAGQGISSYAPFPPEILSPSQGESITTFNSVVSLKWQCSDADNDIAGYDIYVGMSSNNLSLLSKGHVASSYNYTVPNRGYPYYWKIIAKDSNGNSSESGIYSFYAY